MRKIDRPGPQYDVVIVGASIAGCAAAQALALADSERRRRILVIDRHRGVSPRFAGELIHPRGAQILEDLGFYGPLRAAGAVDVEGFSVLERADGRYVELAYEEIVGQRPRGLAAHHKSLVRVMRGVIAAQPQIDLCEGWVIKELRRDRQGVACGALLECDGAEVLVRADVVIGADGKASAVRRLAGLPDERETLGFTAGLEIKDAAVRAPRFGNVVLGAWGPMLIYPIAEGADGALTYRITIDLPQALPAKGARLAEFLLDAYVPFLPERLAEQTAEALRGRRGAIEMAPTVNLPAPRAALPGIALIGDAAGCSHPITASGMTMGLRDAERLGEEARRRARAPRGERWLDEGSLRRYRAEHDRYVPTRQALADAIYEAFRGGNEGARAIQRALFEYWESGPSARRRSMALLSCAEGRPSVFLSEYIKTAGHALGSSIVPRHATHFPLQDRARQVRGAVSLATDKLGLVTQVMWAQIRPAWLPREA
jgi:squalene monooxygenase